MCRKLFLLISFVLVLGLAIETIGATDPNIEYDAEIREALSPPTIDGIVDPNEWTKAIEYPIDYIVVGDPNEVNDTNDLYGTWKALWDYDNLYFLVEVNDEALWRDSGASYYQDDCVEIFIDADNSKEVNDYDYINDYQYQMPWANPPENAVYAGPFSAHRSTATDGVVVAFQDTAKGYRCEVMFPWTTLWGSTPNDMPGPDSLIGLELQLDDDDNGGDRENTMLWSDGKYFGITDDSFKWANVFATAKLISVMGAYQARRPSPRNKAVNVAKNVTLSWDPGDYTQNVNGHDVYFGTDETAVTDANDPNTPPGRGRQDANSYSVPETLNLGQTYYWRIDEVNDAEPNSPWKGRIWSFTVTDFIYVDSFETYTGAGTAGDSDLKLTWTQDGGATLYLMNGEAGEETHWGQNAMEIWYYNGGGYPVSYSAGSRASGDPNWTREDVKALYLHFMGEATNKGAELYVELEDTSGNTARLTYNDAGGTPDVNAVQLTKWTLWRIDLQDFVAANNVDLTNVARLAIGVGDEGATPPASAVDGYVYIDDIRLVQSRCLSEYGVDADFNGDCMINAEDLGVIVDNWLESGYSVPVSAPNDANLAAWWKFDDAAGPNAVDSSGNGHTGTLFGGPVWVSGKFGGALQFDGVDATVLAANYSGIAGPNSRTVTAWVKLDESQASRKDDVISWGTAASLGARWVLTLDYGIPFLGLEGGWTKGDVVITDGQWHLVTVSAPANATNHDIQFYVDGRLNVSSYSNRTVGINTDPSSSVTMGYYNSYYKGLMDDVRIYDYVLSDLEVKYLYTGGTGLIPLQDRTANLYEDEQIDFKDFAVLADKWLEEQQWPR